MWRKELGGTFAEMRENEPASKKAQGYLSMQGGGRMWLGWGTGGQPLDKGWWVEDSRTNLRKEKLWSLAGVMHLVFQALPSKWPFSKVSHSSRRSCSNPTCSPKPFQILRIKERCPCAITQAHYVCPCLTPSGWGVPPLLSSHSMISTENWLYPGTVLSIWLGFDSPI